MGIALWVEQNIGYRLLMLHDKLYKSTNGRVGHHIPLPGVAPSLLLHTVGAKTGKQRTNTLSYFFPDRGDYLVVASKGGRSQGARLVPQPQGQPAHRDQPGAKAIGRDRHTRAPG